ncbi:hypothetical protein L1766_01555 [Thermovorax subterraneus]|nr:hypothetical protein [Thermovorax subterraneus]
MAIRKTLPWKKNLHPYRERKLIYKIGAIENTSYQKLVNYWKEHFLSTEKH